MTKDEMKDRISMALKDPILQQGFECICKENAELKEEVKNNEDLATVAYMQGAESQKKKSEKKLTKAKEIIKKFSEFVNNEVEYDPEHPQEHTDLWNELCGQAEQFLKEIEK
ncbi:hypothetical protein [uncultured Treponema sp.]|uniref:hypothetical protein n=1 Tax=uncultured Treponema sp. TaxID=162155 RepID=UPI0025DE8EAB|nr:hypothetical protein [uncultured Treponema sp.]